ncbi:hypothetical protein KA107_03240 [Candidatus Pacearchaeota archaeon]|nr:hypothetical protein [Candidatus Pacearchaeota archaeon]
MQILAFLVKAKKSTYASGNKAKILGDGFHEFVFEEGELKYRDRYQAKDPRPFGGEEVVFEKGNAIWMMNYYGFMTSDTVDSKPVYVFLRKAMSLVDEEMPFRGPAKFQEGDFEYINECEGNVDKFKGTEIILSKRKEVYRLEYHGGKI